VARQLRRRSASGIALVDVISTLAVLPILAVVSVPSFQHVTEAYAHREALRKVEPRLRGARLKSVGANQPLVRFNCPVAGQHGTVDPIRTLSEPTADDSSAKRCQETVYPSPASDNNLMTKD
jgi:Tfp pilus assembly protein FimT